MQERISGSTNIKSDETKSNQRFYITELLKQHEEFLVIGLTGRIGSGCSEAASILGSSFAEIGLPPIYPGDMGLADDCERDKRILYRYAVHHWLPFDVIKVRTIITSFLLDKIDPLCNEIASILYPGEKNGAKEVKKEIFNGTFKVLRDKCPCNEAIRSQFEKVQRIYANYGDDSFDFEKMWNDGLLQLKEDMRSSEEPSATKVNSTDVELADAKIGSVFKNLFAMAANDNNYGKRIDILKELDTLLDYLSARAAYGWWIEKIGKIKTKISEKQTNAVGAIGNVMSRWTKVDELDFKKYIFVHNIIPAISDAIHDCIAKNKGSLFTELYQKYGNSIRRYGEVAFGEADMPRAGEMGNNAFSIPRRINQFIKSLRHPFSRSFAKPTRIAIDSIKSVFEANYLRERYSAFYLFAISTEESVRVKRLTSEKNLNLREIHCIDWNEYSNYGAEKYQNFLNDVGESEQPSTEALYNKLLSEKKFDEDEIAFIKKIEGSAINGAKQVVDYVRRDAYKNKLNQFVLQDVGASIQSADVFISNNHSEKTKNMDLRWELVRNISLISHPGLLLPTPIERCMQVAFTAKANSGCLSRQVGAVVTDEEYNILSIGWNDVPCGDISCSRKNLADIYNEQDLQAYSDYEIYNEDFRNRVRSKYNSKVHSSSDKLGTLLCGLPWRYCFKDLHVQGKQPMRSRAMHAEEKALSNVQDNAINGCLFTTSSPCEMCSKNAKNHRIKKIYYIEPYPGISEAQYSNSGDPNNRAEHILFTGAIGRAYTQMYTPIMPHKDILEFLGV